MSLINSIVKKKEKKLFDEELSANGIALGEIKYQNSPIMQSRAFLCIVRALLIFMASAGTICGTVSSFHLAFNVPLVLISILAISIYIAFIYYNKLTFYVGYILFFIIFTISIISYYWYVNSGFQAFMNTLNQEYSTYFYLNSAREATEYISNRYLTVSIAMIFTSAFLGILLNITISGYMNLLETFLITFPIIQTALYIELKPNILYIIMLLTVYVTVAVLGRSGHYKLPDIATQRKHFIHQNVKKKKQLTRNHTYVSDGIGMISTTIWSILFCCTFIFITSSVFYSDMDAKHASNTIKDTTDEYIKSFVQNGIYTFFDRYESKGGLSGGRLGGVSAVNPDYQTDLIVEFPFLNGESIYLKSYIGTTYINNSFISPPNDLSYVDDYFFNPYSGQPSAYMYIENIDANVNYNDAITPNNYSTYFYNYLPYYSADVEDNIYTDLSLPYNYMVAYQPYAFQMQFRPSNAPSKDYEAYVYDTYLDVPQYLDETLEPIIEELDIDYVIERYVSAPNNDVKQEALLQIASALRSYYWMNYAYTMAPGTTPYNRDFVSYFLTYQKRGYCAHFAASATLLLRQMGIPARYVEGYMISLTDILEAEVIDEDLSNWLDPDYDLGMDSGVLRVEVTDGSAHAWTEIYIDGFGWIPFDFTPPSDDEMAANFTFATLFAGMFMDISDGEQQNAGGPNGGVNSDFIDTLRYHLNNTLGFIIIPLVSTFIIIVLVIILRECLPLLIQDIKISRNISKGLYNEALTIRYQRFTKRYIRYSASQTGVTPIELNELVKSKALSADDKEHLADTSEKICRILGQAIYGNVQITKESYKASVSWLKNVLKLLKRKNKK